MLRRRSGSLLKVRFGALCGLKSSVAPGLKSAKLGRYTMGTLRRAIGIEMRAAIPSGLFALSHRTESSDTTSHYVHAKPPRWVERVSQGMRVSCAIFTVGHQPPLCFVAAELAAAAAAAVAISAEPLPTVWTETVALANSIPASLNAAISRLTPSRWI
jgi:hypothetical protein